MEEALFSGVPKLSMTYEEAEQSCGISVRTLQELVSRGKLPVSYAGGRRPVILTETLHQFLKEGEILKNQ